MDPTGHGNEQPNPIPEPPERLIGGSEAKLVQGKKPSTTRGGVYYALETGAEVLSPIPLGLSDPEASIHPLANTKESSSWSSGQSQVAEDYRAFKEGYGRSAQAIEGAVAMKAGGKVGKVVGATLVLGAVVFGSLEVNGTQGEEGSFGPDKGDREPLPGDKEKPAPYRGGPHAETKKPKLDERDSHHLLADTVSPIERGKGPAIQMDPADHRQTLSSGGKPENVEYRARIKALLDEGKYREAMAAEIRDVRRVAGSKYNAAIKQALKYAETLKELEFLKKAKK